MPEYVKFQNVEAPLELKEVPQLVEPLTKILSGWPLEILNEAPPSAPFFTISQGARPGRYFCTDCSGNSDPKHVDEINAICDVIAALPRALAATNDSLICLHAAAVAFGKGLVVFPNIRRAGKSTLSAALAMKGHPVFGDDVLPTAFDENGKAIGHALGASPRLRLPLPEEFPSDFKTWVHKQPGPQNKQYKYLNLDAQPHHGSRSQVAGFAILDRQDNPVPARLEPVKPDVAMDALLYQNFTRDRHSADILTSMAECLSVTPCYRLTYSGLTDAVECLQSQFGSEPADHARATSVPLRRFRMADLTSDLAAPIQPETGLRQRDGTSKEVIGETLYFADPDGRAIHRMDPIAQAIWDLLSEPTCKTELLQILTDAFSEVAPKRIANDLDALLTRLGDAGLIENS